jgi:hypothetical protein
MFVEAKDVFSAMLLALSTVALAQFGLYYWRAVVTGVAVQPVSEHVFHAAHVKQGELSGDDFRSLAELHQLTPDLDARRSGLGLVPLYFQMIQAVGKVAAGRIDAVANWAENERVLCARFAAVQVDRRLQANLALAASIRSC